MITKYFDADIEYIQYEKVCPNGQCSLVKTASNEPDIFKDIKMKKNHAYLFVIAMGAGDYYGPNRNGDFFWEKDLINDYKKFLTSGVFIQHQNKDPEKSIGKVLKAIYNPKMHRVELVIEISKEKAPHIYQAIENGERISVSMGTNVTEESCSLCGHITKNSLANRCEHLKKQMNKVTEEGIQIYAINHPPLNFFDISIVRTPADIQGYALFQKTASSNYDEKEIINSKEEMLEKLSDILKRINAEYVSNEEGKNLTLLRSIKKNKQSKKTFKEKLANFYNQDNDAFGNKPALHDFTDSKKIKDDGLVKKYAAIELIFINGEEMIINPALFFEYKDTFLKQKTLSSIIGITPFGEKMILWSR